jgi:uncharacterized protein (DUF433 family)
VTTFVPGLLGSRPGATPRPIPPQPAESPVLQAQPPDLAPDSAAPILALFGTIDPSDPAESIVLARLRQLMLRLEKSALAEPVGPGDPAWHRYESQVDRSFRAVLSLWIRIRAAAARQQRAAVRPRRAATPKPSEPPTPPAPADLPESVPDSARPSTAVPSSTLSCPTDWLDRLVLDPAVNPSWPVVRGTTVWADHVASMLEDGWEPAEILQRYPSLALEDVAACRQADSLGLCGPWPDGKPPQARSANSSETPWPPRRPG